MNKYLRGFIAGSMMGIAVRDTVYAEQKREVKRRYSVTERTL